MSALTIVAQIEALPQHREDVLKAIKTITPASQKEEGNISYKAHQDVKDKNKFIILEEWKSQQAIDFHNNTDHFSTFKKQIDGKVKSLDIAVITEI